jgi:hypothetical protein
MLATTLEVVPVERLGRVDAAGAVVEGAEGLEEGGGELSISVQHEPALGRAGASFAQHGVTGTARHDQVALVHRTVVTG